MIVSKNHSYDGAMFGLVGDSRDSKFCLLHRIDSDRTQVVASGPVESFQVANIIRKQMEYGIGCKLVTSSLYQTQVTLLGHRVPDSQKEFEIYLCTLYIQQSSMCGPNGLQCI